LLGIDVDVLGALPPVPLLPEVGVVAVEVGVVAVAVGVVEVEVGVVLPTEKPLATSERRALSERLSAVTTRSCV
jgi:hypothetical protein